MKICLHVWLVLGFQVSWSRWIATNGWDFLKCVILDTRRKDMGSWMDLWDCGFSGKSWRSVHGSPPLWISFGGGSFQTSNRKTFRESCLRLREEFNTWETDVSFTCRQLLQHSEVFSLIMCGGGYTKWLFWM